MSVTSGEIVPREVAELFQKILHPLSWTRHCDDLFFFLCLFAHLTRPFLDEYTESRAEDKIKFRMHNLITLHKIESLFIHTVIFYLFLFYFISRCQMIRINDAYYEQ